MPGLLLPEIDPLIELDVIQPNTLHCFAWDALKRDRCKGLYLAIPKLHEELLLVISCEAIAYASIAIRLSDARTVVEYCDTVDYYWKSKNSHFQSECGKAMPMKAFLISLSNHQVAQTQYLENDVRVSKIKMTKMSYATSNEIGLEIRTNLAHLPRNQLEYDLLVDARDANIESRPDVRLDPELLQE
ncbi:hypothetical protein L228DRAFT_265979 [Xylona heveae TC161]|uniref:Uncharacterized protein n=1 Tax=Xylona heveae (strain CBS 132557 / TC161) TaxID=1328760 RepID=A0A165IXM1_XYLHT|nr:hypothetical protein L228DRAFT_265979 [Xylona heveae TC161]KZF25513.1 hypothetical protein L228DRAFT_265979 [Xylona heveae TC161]